MAVEAQLDILQTRTRRGAVRRSVTLRGRGASTEGQATEVLIQNLSESGLLFESPTSLAVGQRIVIELPDIERISATVVWASHKLLGCAFDHRLPRAAVSAAELRSPPKRMSEALEKETRTRIVRGDQKFGARLRDLRKRSGLSLVEFSRRMNVSRPTVWSWEAGKSLPRQSKLRSLLDVLGVGEGDLYGTPSDPPVNHDSGESPARENALQIAISKAKAQVAEIAGTSPEKIKLIIEV